MNLLKKTGLVSIDSVYQILWWVLLFGACFGGNMTIIGSTANLIAIGSLEKAGRGTIPFGQWFKVGFFVGIITLAFVWLIFMFVPHFR